MNKRIFICDNCSKLYEEYQSNRIHMVNFCCRKCSHEYKTGILKYTIEKELLLSLYWGNQYSIRRIAKLFITDGHTIKRYLDRYTIPIRNRSETGKLFDNSHSIGKKPWNDNLTHLDDERIPYGKESGGWKGGISTKNERMRRCRKLIDWRNTIFRRDSYTCQICHNKSKKGNRIEINAHHIKPWAKYPDLRYDIENGITLCVDCHKLIHKGYRLDI